MITLLVRTGKRIFKLMTAGTAVLVWNTKTKKEKEMDWRNIARPIIVIGLIVCVVLFGVYKVKNVYSDFMEEYKGTDSNMNGTSVEVTIPEETTIKEAAGILKDAGLIKYKLAFQLRMTGSQYSNSLQPGTYTLNTGMSTMDMIKTLCFVESTREVLYTLTVPEGFTVEQIADRCEELGFCSSNDFLKECQSGDFEYPFEIPSTEVKYALQGFLFPATYDIYDGMTPKDLIQDMIDKGLAYESQGATVVDIQEDTDSKELPPCIIRKSDGAALYATSDLATIVERERDYHPDSYIYLADKRQELHFTQVFRVAKKAGIVKPDASLTFLGFGTMNGKDGKPFKTRDGGTMRLEILISDIQKAVLSKMEDNAKKKGQEDGDSSGEAYETARMIGLAALKYGDLSNQASKDYVFDIDRFTSFEGNTGPYILYTIVRIKSILSKYVQAGGECNNLKIMPPSSDSEKNLALALVRFSEVIDSAYMDNAPHKICQYIYDVSNVFNGFYHDTKILSEADEEKKKGYIAILSLTKDILLTCIDLLGIECPERM